MPFHLALAVVGAALAWLTCMAPALVRPDGPQRIAVARALEAAARPAQRIHPGLDTAPMAVIGRLNRCFLLLLLEGRLGARQL